MTKAKKTYPFDPDWVIAPGETLREWMETNNLRPSSMALICGRMPEELFNGVLSGETPITEEIAEGLQIGTAIPATLWLNLERIFRAGLNAGRVRL